MQLCQFFYIVLFVNRCALRVVSEVYFNREAWRLFSLVVFYRLLVKAKRELFFLEQQTCFKPFTRLVVYSSTSLTRILYTWGLSLKETRDETMMKIRWIQTNSDKSISIIFERQKKYCNRNSLQRILKK